MKPFSKLLCLVKGHARRKCVTSTPTHRHMQCARCGDIEHRPVRTQTGAVAVGKKA